MRRQKKRGGSTLEKSRGKSGKDGGIKYEPFEDHKIPKKSQAQMFKGEKRGGKRDTRQVALARG